MAVNEQIVTGRKFRKLIDEANKIWQRISFWTKASDVEFNDGKNAETKIGAINGITNSLTSTASNIAASAAAVKALNDKVTESNSNIKPKFITQTYTVTIPDKNPYNLYTSFPHGALGVTQIAHNSMGTEGLLIDSVSGNTVVLRIMQGGVATIKSVTVIGY